MRKRALPLLAAAASFLSLAGAACQGERANYARDASITVPGEAGRGGDGLGGTGGDQPDADAERPFRTTSNGSNCASGSECISGFCVDKVCCNESCEGTCRTCASGTTPGTCTFADPGTDPRSECPDQGVTSCGLTGSCNGTGACQRYTMGFVCDPTPSCSSAGTEAITNKVCNATSACVPAAMQSCGSYRCDNGACGKTCVSDNQCATGYFCSAGACVGTTNLAGNGDLETGTTTGWTAFAGGTLGLSSPASGGVAHGGDTSIFVTGRTQQYQGPQYQMPSGLGQYVISAWALQNENASLTGVLQLIVGCATMSFYKPVQPSGFGVTMNQGMWTLFSATIDTARSTAMPADCDPNATPPGLVKSSSLYLSQVNNGTPVALPALYMDDLVVQVTDGHNLVGNPNFEAATTDGWSVSATSTLGVSATVAHGGTHSLSQSGRTTTSSGPRYILPIGTARYRISLYVRHGGTLAHDLALQPTYTCIGGGQVMGTQTGKVTVPAGSGWAELSGTLTFPPATAPAGCKLSQATFNLTQEAGTCGTAATQVECPDLFVDDVSITLAP